MATKAFAEAEADKIKSIGEAEGEAEKAKGLGIAEATKEQINAYNEMVNANFLADHYIDIMPEIAKYIAEPLSAVDNITMYGSGNAAALAEETTKMVSQVNNGLADSLGIDLKNIINNVVGGAVAGRSFANNMPDEVTNITSSDNELPESIEDVTKPNSKPVKTDGDTKDINITIQ